MPTDPPETGDPTRHLLGAAGTADYRDGVRAAAARVAARVAAADRPVSDADRAAVRARVDAVDLARPLAERQRVLDEVEDLYLRQAVYFHHPRYMAHLNCPVAVPALVAETILTAVNSSMDTFDQSVGGTAIEQRLVRWVADLVGLGSAADGVFTSGGTQSNLQALALARDEARARGARGRRRILTSTVAHFSVRTSADLLGLPDDAVRTIPVDGRRRMRPDALAAEIARCEADGDTVVAVVATAGTTDFGSIDPLPVLARICADAGVWLHVDAAWGCGLLVSPTRRAALDGIERADSVTVDFHKAYFQPISSSAVLVRDRATLRHVLHQADYLNPADGHNGAVGENQVDKSLQTTRRFDALKLWMTLREMGADALGVLVDRVVDLADEVWHRLDADPRFEVVVRPELSSLVLRWVGDDPAARPDDDLLDAVVHRVRRELFADGEAVVGSTVVDGRAHFKLTLLNPSTSADEVAEVVDLIAARARALTGATSGAPVAAVAR